MPVEIPSMPFESFQKISRANTAFDCVITEKSMARTRRFLSRIARSSALALVHAGLSQARIPTTLDLPAGLSAMRKKSSSLAKAVTLASGLVPEFSRHTG